jgi:DNA polymerase III sliding clamp (beta) subunit (PCNA family)
VAITSSRLKLGRNSTPPWPNFIGCGASSSSARDASSELKRRPLSEGKSHEIIFSKAPDLKTAVDLAAAASDPKHKIPVLGHLHIFTGGEDRVVVRANTMDHVLDAVVPAQIEAEGEVVVPGQRLAAYVSGFPSGAELTVGRAGEITCARSRCRLPTIDPRDLPQVRSLDEVIGEIELSGADALRLFTLLLPYCGTEPTRYYISGIYIANHNGGLLSAATDGKRLLQLELAAEGALSQDRRLIIPAKACGLAVKLLRRKPAQVTLRRSRTSFQILAPEFQLTTALIDADFPDFERLFPNQPPVNTAVVDHAELAAALARLEAVVDPALKVAPTVGITWPIDGDSVELTLVRQKDCASEIVAAEITGACRVAADLVQLPDIADLGERVRFRVSDDAYSPIVIDDPDNANVIGLLMPVRWNFAEAA